MPQSSIQCNAWTYCSFSWQELSLKNLSIFIYELVCLSIGLYITPQIWWFMQHLCVYFVDSFPYCVWWHCWAVPSYGGNSGKQFWFLAFQPLGLIYHSNLPNIYTIQIFTFKFLFIKFYQYNQDLYMLNFNILITT